jgi:ketosteroid isomerase-like protein
MIHDPSIRAWLQDFATCVRKRDLELGKTLFASDVRAFGTVTEAVHGLDLLMDQQWRPVWFTTQDFQFLAETTVASFSGDRSLVCVSGLWKSNGLTPDGGQFVRRGRCTVLLRREDASAHGYVATHTHFSKTPEGAL